MNNGLEVILITVGSHRWKFYRELSKESMLLSSELAAGLAPTVHIVNNCTKGHSLQISLNKLTWSGQGSFSQSQLMNFEYNVAYKNYNRGIPVI